MTRNAFRITGALWAESSTDTTTHLSAMDFHHKWTADPMYSWLFTWTSCRTNSRDASNLGHNVTSVWWLVIPQARPHPMAALQFLREEYAVRNVNVRGLTEFWEAQTKPLVGSLTARFMGPTWGPSGAGVTIKINTHCKVTPQSLCNEPGSL